MTSNAASSWSRSADFCFFLDQHSCFRRSTIRSCTCFARRPSPVQTHRPSVLHRRGSNISRRTALSYEIRGSSLSRMRSVREPNSDRSLVRKPQTVDWERAVSDRAACAGEEFYFSGPPRYLIAMALTVDTLNSQLVAASKLLTVVKYCFLL